jgi:phospholipid transport system substrate-binding protein
MVNMPPRFIILVLAVFAAFAPARQSAAEAKDAAALFIDGLAQRAIELMKQEELAPAQREEEVRALLNDGFEMRMIARAVLGRNWRRATAEQQSEFLVLFSDYVVKTYAKRLGAFTGQSLNVNRSVPINDKETIVQTSLQGTTGPDTRIDWRVRKIKDQPRIIDVVVEGVSMLTTQRSTYTSVIAREGVDGLIKSMREVAGRSPD